MTLTFRLRFGTRFGQSLFITGDHPLLGGGDPARAVPLQYRDADTWEVSLRLDPPFPDARVRYNYILREEDGTQVGDWGSDKAICPEWFQEAEVLVIDAWNNAAYFENAFYTEPFKEVLLRPSQVAVRGTAAVRVTHTFRVKAPLLTSAQTLCLLGSFNGWDTASPPLLERTPGEDLLQIGLDLGAQAIPLEYKYGVYDVEQRAFVRYEDGANRRLEEAAKPGRKIIVNDGFAILPSTTWKGAGVAIPVFSLRSERSFGIGEFSDLKLLSNWCKQTGLKLIQLLPVNDTTATHTWTDSYPYSAISAFALHPIYLDLGRVVSGRNRRRLEELEPERRRLNGLAEIDYEAVLKAKLGFLRRVYPSEKGRVFRSRAYRQFFSENRDWLVPYAAFCHLRDRFGTADFSQWPAFRTCVAAEIEALAAPDSETGDDLAFHFFLQFHLHVQLQDATAQAHRNGVILKGDIAIGVCRFGADAWQHPELFHLDVQAGAPPDAFAAKGQNWGFPTYNWPRMKQDGFAWWKQRFAQMARYFDAFRIDHILGFFRIWSIPLHAVEGILGVFVPALPVKPAEFLARGILFDRSRFARPYITEAVLREMFGFEAAAVKRQFLELDPSGRLSLKPEFATQRQVAAYFDSLPAGPGNDRLRAGLFDLISNVILIETDSPDGPGFHFRFDMEGTWSFKLLPPVVQFRLKGLYMDYFFRRQDAFWMREAMQKLPALKRVTNMLVCGEDLGLVPGCVPETMRQLGLLSLEIQRMPKRLGQEFFRPAEAPYMAVVSPSTHDMSTIRGWWLEDPAATQRFFNRELRLPGTAARDCGPLINRAIVVQHLESPAMWSIFQLQDLLGMDAALRRADPAEERINVPANPKHYWRYRLHLTLESLEQERDFNAALRQLLHQRGRTGLPAGLEDGQSH